MKRICLLIISISFSISSYAQEINESTFNFWVGDWEISWTDAKGKLVKGENKIVKILGDKVIQENFKDLATHYTGMSLSIFNSNTRIWHQTWMDSDGGHFIFTGTFIDGNPSFQTAEVKKGDEILQQRMVFKDIRKDKFVWIWEGTKNGGESWGELWKINYKRKTKE